MAQLSKVFFPYDPLPAQDLNDMVGFMNGVADGTNLEDGAVTAAKIDFATYSTTEQVIGTWIDGKTIYRKVFSITTNSSDSTQIIAHGISGLSQIIDMYGTVYNSGSAQYRTLGRNFTGNNALYVRADTANIYLNAYEVPNQSSPAIVIIEYTK